MTALQTLFKHGPWTKYTSWYVTKFTLFVEKFTKYEQVTPLQMIRLGFPHGLHRAEFLD